jgi:hypothetical protein
LSSVFSHRKNQTTKLSKADPEIGSQNQPATTINPKFQKFLHFWGSHHKGLPLASHGLSGIGDAFQNQEFFFPLIRSIYIYIVYIYISAYRSKWLKYTSKVYHGSPIYPIGCCLYPMSVYFLVNICFVFLILFVNNFFSTHHSLTVQFSDVCWLNPQPPHVKSRLNPYP